MIDNATPKPRAPRPIHYPAAIPRTMTTAAQREALDAIRAAREWTFGAVVRGVLDLGLVLDAALAADPALGPEIERLAREGGVEKAEAVRILIRFAVDESKRRVERNARIAHEVGAGLGEMGFMVDGVSIGGLDLNAHG